MRCSEKAGKSAQQTRRSEPRISRQTQSRPSHVSAKRENHIVSIGTIIQGTICTSCSRETVYSRVSLPHVAGMMILAEAESRCFHLLLSAPFCPPILKPHLKHKTVGARFIYRRRGLKRFNSTFNPVKTSKTSIKTNVAGAGAWLHLLVHATFNLENHAFRIV